MDIMNQIPLLTYIKKNPVLFKFLNDRFLYYLFCFLFSSFFLYVVHSNDFSYMKKVEYAIHSALLMLKVVLSCMVIELYFRFKMTSSSFIKHYKIWQISVFFAISFACVDLICQFIFELSPLLFEIERKHALQGRYVANFANSALLAFFVSLLSINSVKLFNKRTQAEKSSVKNPSKTYIRIKNNGIDEKVELSCIEYIKVEENYCYLWTYIAGEKVRYTIRKTLAKVIDELASEHFIQIHRSYVVNTQFISKVEKSSGKLKVYVSSNEQLPVSPRHMYKLNDCYPQSTDE